MNWVRGEVRIKVEAHDEKGSVVTGIDARCSGELATDIFLGFACACCLLVVTTADVAAGCCWRRMGVPSSAEYTDAPVRALLATNGGGPVAGGGGGGSEGCDDNCWMMTGDDEREVEEDGEEEREFERGKIRFCCTTPVTDKRC